ncbi:hypothetical protein HORM4_660047 [Vibrio harveyi]|nr:hypothetical protein HORM4_660047 [Vibrio harveyi]
MISTLRNQHFAGAGRDPQTISLGLYEANGCDYTQKLGLG